MTRWENIPIKKHETTNNQSNNQTIERSKIQIIQIKQSSDQKSNWKHEIPMTNQPISHIVMCKYAYFIFSELIYLDGVGPL